MRLDGQPSELHLARSLREAKVPQAWYGGDRSRTYGGKGDEGRCDDCSGGEAGAVAIVRVESERGAFGRPSRPFLWTLKSEGVHHAPGLHRVVLGREVR